MIDTLTDPLVLTVVVIAGGLYLAVRIFTSFRVGFRRKKTEKLSEADAASLHADVRVLAVMMEERASAARGQADGAESYAPLALDFSLPHRFQGDTRKLDRLPAPYGPLLALAVRKAQSMLHRLHDPNWEGAQRREGRSTGELYQRLAKDFEAAAAQARRVERLLKDAAPGPTRRLKVVKR